MTPPHDYHLAIVVERPRQEVFDLLADIESMPRWAPGFCERLDLHRGRWLGLTAHGELYLELEAHERSGVIDLVLGNDRAPFGRLLLRVVDHPRGGALLICDFLPQHAPRAVAGQALWQTLVADLTMLATGRNRSTLEEPASFQMAPGG